LNVRIVSRYASLLGILFDSLFNQWQPFALAVFAFNGVVERAHGYPLRQGHCQSRFRGGSACGWHHQIPTHKRERDGVAWLHEVDFIRWTFAEPRPRSTLFEAN